MSSNVRAFDRHAKLPSPDHRSDAPPVAERDSAPTPQPERIVRRNILVRFLSGSTKWLIHAFVDQFLPGSNLLGFLVLLGAYGIVMTVKAELIEIQSENLQNLLMGFFCIAIDLALRALFRRLSLQQADGGPCVVYFPVWLLGSLICIASVVKALFG